MMDVLIFSFYKQDQKCSYQFCNILYDGLLGVEESRQDHYHQSRLHSLLLNSHHGWEMGY